LPPFAIQHGKNDVIHPLATKEIALDVVGLLAEAKRAQQGDAGDVTWVDRTDRPAITPFTKREIKHRGHRLAGVAPALPIRSERNAEFDRVLGGGREMYPEVADQFASGIFAYRQLAPGVNGGKRRSELPLDEGPGLADIPGLPALVSGYGIVASVTVKHSRIVGRQPVEVKPWGVDRYVLCRVHASPPMDQPVHRARFLRTRYPESALIGQRFYVHHEDTGDNLKREHATMSILVITGPRHDALTAPLVDAAMCRLWERAQAAGVDLCWRPCRDFTELRGCLRAGEGAELVLLDVDADAVPERDVAGLRDALAALPVPYIEVHDDSREADASALVPGHPSLVSVVVPGDAAAGYDMALSIGLRYLAAGVRVAA